jgi:hypothetical protein
MVTVRAVGKGAVGSCEHDDGCKNEIELTRNHCCGNGPGGGRWGCGKYLCAEHLPHVFEENRPHTRGTLPRAPRVWNLCEDCWERLERFMAGPENAPVPQMPSYSGGGPPSGPDEAPDDIEDGW